MDSANIHLLIENLIAENHNINLFTIHDCFASTPNTMKLLNIEVRKAFSMMYFDLDYIKSMHEDFIVQINNYKNIYRESPDDKNKPLPFLRSDFDKLNVNEKLFILNNKK